MFIYVCLIDHPSVRPSFSPSVRPSAVINCLPDYHRPSTYPSTLTSKNNYASRCLYYILTFVTDAGVLLPVVAADARARGTRALLTRVRHPAARPHARLHRAPLQLVQARVRLVTHLSVLPTSKSTGNLKRVGL